MNERESRNAEQSPPVRLRFMAGGIAVVVLLCAPPLLMVWKQAYITNSSLKLEAMADTLSGLNREAAALRLQAAALASTERIERFARSALGLEYPSLERIVIIQMDEHDRMRGGAGRTKGQHSAAVQGGVSKGGRE